MFEGKGKVFALVATFACGIAPQAFAQTQGCIELKSIAETEQEVVNAAGQKTLQRTLVNKVVPGTVVIITVTANNVCKKPSDNVVINNPVPEHMSYVASSAAGQNSDITFSVDGAKFAPSEQLTVSEAGVARKARSDEYRSIRWTFRGALAPGASAVASFRATLN
jgi:uncharacterized repeat protein (TIGR01451 family)